MDDSTKTLVDIGAGSLTLSAFLDVVPSVTAVFTLIWVLIRSWETDTVKTLTGRSDPFDWLD